MGKTIDVDSIIGLAEAAEILGLSRSNFIQHRNRYSDGNRREQMFPDPLIVLRCGPLWDRKDIVEWREHYQSIRRPIGNPWGRKGKPKDEDDAQVTAKAPAKSTAKAPAKATAKAAPKTADKAKAPAKAVAKAPKPVTKAPKPVTKAPKPGAARKRIAA